MKGPSAQDLALRAAWLRAETSRIANVTLAGTFANPADREHWVARLRKLNSELQACEELLRPRPLRLKTPARS